MEKKVSKKEYDNWVKKTYYSSLNDTSIYYVRVLNRCAIVDLESKKTVFYDSDNDGYGSVECIVKAYSELKGLKIPEVEEVEEIPQPWRAEKGNVYYTVDSLGGILNFKDDRSYADDDLYNIGNYFKTKERAEEVANKITLIFKLERLHDLYCPEFKPNFKNSEEIKYDIYFDHRNNLYRIYEHYTITEDITGTYFTEEAAEKVCEILNKELNETLR